MQRLQTDRPCTCMGRAWAGAGGSDRLAGQSIGSVAAEGGRFTPFLSSFLNAIRTIVSRISFSSATQVPGESAGDDPSGAFFLRPLEMRGAFPHAAAPAPAPARNDHASTVLRVPDVHGETLGRESTRIENAKERRQAVRQETQSVRKDHLPIAGLVRATARMSPGGRTCDRACFDPVLHPAFRLARRCDLPAVRRQLNWGDADGREAWREGDVPILSSGPRTTETAAGA